MLSSRVRTGRCAVSRICRCRRPAVSCWRNRRLVCAKERCPRHSFLERVAEVLSGLGDRSAASASGHRDCRASRVRSDVAAEHDVAWATAHKGADPLWRWS